MLPQQQQQPAEKPPSLEQQGSCHQLVVLRITSPSSSLQQGSCGKSKHCWQCLHVHDLLVCCEASIDSRHKHAEKEEDLEVECADPHAVEQPRCQEAIVEALISSEGGSGLGKVWLGAKGLHAPGCGPQKHLQDQEVDMEQSHCDGEHVCQHGEGPHSVTEGHRVTEGENRGSSIFRLLQAQMGLPDKESKSVVKSSYEYRNRT